MNNLRGVDLNLLVVFDALVAECHVSRASVRLGMSQPAVSHALSRLRHLFDDPLLVRRGGKLLPSAKALQLAAPVSEALRLARSVLEPVDFDPGQEKREFHIEMSDYGSAVVLPQLIRIIRDEAPQTDIVVTQSSRKMMMQKLLDGETDLALGVFTHIHEQLEVSDLFVEDFVCVTERVNLSEAEGLDLKAYLARPHVHVAVGEDSVSEIDRALAAIGCERRISIMLPHWSRAVELIRGTDLVLTIAARALGDFASSSGLEVFAPPFPVPSFPFRQIWHERKNGDPAHLWLREAVTRAARANA